jgi:hypothetical protein
LTQIGILPGIKLDRVIWLNCVRRIKNWYLIGFGIIKFIYEWNNNIRFWWSRKTMWWFVKKISFVLTCN